MRIAFVIIPELVFRAHWVDGGPLSQVPALERERTVLVEGEGGRATIRAVAPDLRAEGIRSAMTVARARAQVGHIWAQAYEGFRVERESSKLAGVLLAASPQVHVVGDGVFWVGADGCRLLGGEGALLSLIGDLIIKTGYRAPQLGLADTIIAARAAAVHGLGRIPPGEDAAALAPLPLTALPLDESSREALWALGIKTVGAFAILPARQISSRFGQEALAAHRLARGEDQRSVPVLGDEKSPDIEVDFESPHRVAEPALFVLQGGLDRLIAPHRARGFGISRLSVELRLLDGVWSREIRPADPMTDASRLLEMCRALLQDAELPSMMEGIRASVVEVAPAKARQEGLWTPRRKRTLSLEYVATRLQSRLGNEALWAPASERDELLPERVSVHGEVCLRPSSVRRSAAIDSPATWRLKRPPRRIGLELSNRRPARVELEGRWEFVARTAGPERIETEWWERQDVPRAAARPRPRGIRREYWYTELRSGGALSIFQDLDTGDWFLQGMLD